MLGLGQMKGEEKKDERNNRSYEQLLRTSRTCHFGLMKKKDGHGERRAQFGVHFYTRIECGNWCFACYQKHPKQQAEK